jgi:hypothetical protein
MVFNELLEFLLIGFVGYLAIRVLLAIALTYFEYKVQQRNETIKYITSRIHEVRIEKNKEVEYWYDNDTNEFLAQGSTKEEIYQTIKARFNGHVFLCDDGVVTGPDYVPNKEPSIESLYKVIK